MNTAVDTGLLDPQVVLIEPAVTPAAASSPTPRSPLGPIAATDRPAPTLGAYDELLTGNEG